MKKIIGILLLSVCVTAGAAACGGTEIALDESAAPAAVTSTELTAADTSAAPPASAQTGEEETLAQETAPAPEQTSATICVYVCGEVMTPGVYSLPEGARIYEALALAGGLTTAADTGVVNQAQTLTDGMMVRIPAIGESSAPDPVQTADGTTVMNGTSGTSALVNINTADAAQLMTLPGIGEAKAAAILAFRDQHGSFASKEELKSVSGIGDAIYRNLESRIVVQ